MKGSDLFSRYNENSDILWSENQRKVKKLEGFLNCLSLVTGKKITTSSFPPEERLVERIDSHMGLYICREN